MDYILHEFKIKKPAKEISNAGYGQTTYPSNQPELRPLSCYSGIQTCSENRLHAAVGKAVHEEELAYFNLHQNSFWIRKD